MTTESAITSYAQENLRAKVMRDHSDYVDMIIAIKQLTDPLEFWATVQQLSEQLTQQGLSATNAPASPETNLVRLAAKLPGDLLWQLNKTISDPHQRMAIAKAITKKSPAPLSTTDEPLAVELRETGLLMLPEILTQSEVHEMAAFLGARPDIIREGPVHANIVEDIARAPHALRLATHPRILSLVGAYLGAAPVITDLCAWRTEPSATDDYGAHIFHRDRDDFRACKMFLYLSDVETEDGPHIFARGSHNPSSTARILNQRGLDMSFMKPVFYGPGRQIADTIPAIFGDHVIEITGKAGTSFLEGTYGFHRGKPVKRKDRLLFQVLYATVIYPHRYERFAPIALMDIPEDCIDNELTRYALRGLLAPT